MGFQSGLWFPGSWTYFRNVGSFRVEMGVFYRHSLRKDWCSLYFCKMKQIWKCLKLAFFLFIFFLMARLEGGQQLWLQKFVWFYKSLRENGPTAHLIYDLSKNFLMGLRSQSLVSSLIEYNIIYFCLLRHLFDIYLKAGRKWGNDEQQMAQGAQTRAATEKT